MMRTRDSATSSPEHGPIFEEPEPTSNKSNYILKALTIHIVLFDAKKAYRFLWLNSCNCNWICIGVSIGMGMAWVFDSIDKDPATYKDFIAILKTYIYRQSSYIPCNIHFLDTNKLHLLNSFKQGIHVQC
jgi:hypothetical protein